MLQRVRAAGLLDLNPYRQVSVAGSAARTTETPHIRARAPGRRLQLTARAREAHASLPPRIPREAAGCRLAQEGGRGHSLSGHANRGGNFSQ